MISRLFFGLNLAWLVLLIVVRFSAGERPWPIELLDVFALYAFALFIPLALVALFRRSRRDSALLLGVLLLFIQQFGSAFLPRLSPAAAAGEPLTVLTYNMSSYNRDPSPLARLVAQAHPDLILIQELTARYAKALDGIIGADYPYRLSADTTSAHYGSGTYSRLPITNPLTFSIWSDGNVWQRVDVMIGGHRVRVYNVHLSSPHVSYPFPDTRATLPSDFGSSRREDELTWLEAETDDLTIPYIIGGDFNIPSGSRPYRTFPPTWRDAFAERGQLFGNTFPTVRTTFHGRLTVHWPLVRIDYVLSSSELVPLSATVPWLNGSDHLPVLAELALVTNP